MISLAPKNAIKDLWRTSLLIAGIAFSVSIMVSASVLMDSANIAFRAYFEDNSFYDLEIRPIASETFSFTPKLERLTGGSRFEEKYLVLEQRLNVSSVFAGPFAPEDTQFRIVGLSGFRGPEIQEIRDRFVNSDLNESEFPSDEPMLGIDECILDRDVVTWTHRQRGDNLQQPELRPIHLNLTSNPRIKAIILGGQSVSEALWEAFFHIELLWDSWFPETRLVSAIRIKLHDWTQVYQVKEELEAAIDQDVSVRVLKEVGEEQIVGIRSYEDALQAVILIAASVEFLFVFSQMIVIIFSERRAEIGQLRTLGATRLGILEMFLIESLIYGIIGSIIGAYGGLAGAAVLTRLIGTHLVSTNVSLAISMESVIVALLYGILVTMLAGVLPSTYVAFQPPQLALRSYGRSATPLQAKHSLILLGTGVCLFFLGISLLAQVRTTELVDLKLFMDNALTIGIILLSAIAFEIILIRFLIPLFEKIWQLAPSFVRVISARSILRSFRRNCAAMITAAIGISFVVSASIFAASLEKTIPVFLEDSSISEIIMDTGNGNEQNIEGLLAEIERKPAVLDVGYALGSYLSVDDRRIDIIGISADLLYHSNYLGAPKVVNGPSNAFPMLVQYSPTRNSTCILSASLANDLGLHVGNTILGAIASAAGEEVSIPLEIIALVEPNIFLNNGENIFVSYELLAGHSGLRGRARWFFVASSSAEQTYSSLKSDYSQDFHRIIAVFRKREQIKETIEQQSVLFTVLLAVVMIAGILAQGTAYLIGAIEREREMGILRACGAEQRHIRQIFIVEGGMMTLISIFVGLVNAVLLSSMLFHLASKTIIEVQVEIPFLLIIGWLGTAAIFSYFASQIAYGRIKRMNPAQTLRIPNQ